MDKKQKADQRKLRKKAIKIQNNSPNKVSMAEALRRAQLNDD